MITEIEGDLFWENSNLIDLRQSTIPRSSEYRRSVLVNCAKQVYVALDHWHGVLTASKRSYPVQLTSYYNVVHTPRSSVVRTLPHYLACKELKQ